MIGFSIEFKKWFIVIRGPKGRIYLATGFNKELPVFTPFEPFYSDLIYVVEEEEVNSLVNKETDS